MFNVGFSRISPVKANLLVLNNLMIVDYDFIPEVTYFLQLEQPENCVRTMLDFLEANTLMKA